MERYPSEVTALLAPLVVVQGLVSPRCLETSDRENAESESAAPVSSVEDITIKVLPIESTDNPLYSSVYNDPDALVIERKLPILQGPLASSVASVLDGHNVGDNVLPASNGTEFLKQIIFKIKYVDNNYHLPKQYTTYPTTTVEHDGETHPVNSSFLSPLSPFNSNSPYANMLLPLEWIQKYREVIPSVFVSVYELQVTGDNASDLESDLHLIEDITKAKKAINSRGIRFLCVLICEDSSKLSVESQEIRIDKVRKSTGLPARTGLVFLSSPIPKDISIFVESIVHMAKPWTTDYYNLQIKKLKKQEILDLNYNQSFWLARQSIKNAIFEEMCGITESSTKFMEYCYEKLIDAIKTVDMIKQPELWKQCRVLLDLAGLHITRSYIFLKDSNMAYKKFDIHIQNVLALLPKSETTTYASYSWLATQVTWLAQLLFISPEGIIPIDRPLQPIAKTKWFRGAVNTAKAGISGLSPIPQGGYIYLQACSLIQRRRFNAFHSDTSAADPYLSLPLEQEKKFNHARQCIKVLNGSLDFFSRSKKVKFSRAESYVYFKLGEEYYLDQNYSMAINNYLVSFSAYKDERWLSIVSNILLRLFQCSVKLKNYQDAEIYYLRLSVLPERLIKPLKGHIESQKSVFDHGFYDADDINGDGLLIFKEDVFTSSVVLKTQTILLNEKMEFQIVLNSNLNSLINHTIVEDLTVKFSGSSNEIHVKHASNAEAKRFNVFEGEGEGEDQQTFQTNMLFSGDQRLKIFEFHMLPSHVGKFQIESVWLTVKTLDFDFLNELAFSRHSVDQQKLFVTWFKPSTNRFGKQYESGLVTVKNNPFLFEVIPKQPKVEIDLNSAEYAFSHQVFPVNVHISNEDTESYGLQYDAEATVGTESVLIDWQNGDKALDEFYDLAGGSVKNLEVLVHLPLLKDLPTLSDIQGEGKTVKGIRHETVRISFKFRYKIPDENGVIVETTKVLEIPILTIFKFQFSINSGLNSSIPSVFDLQFSGKQSKEGLVSVVPVHDRVWKAVIFARNASLKPLLLSDIKLNIKAVSADTKAELLEAPGDITKTIRLTSRTDDFYELPFSFVSYCDNNVLKRSVHVEISLSFKYREDQEKDDDRITIAPIQEYEAVVWKGSLPHMDPRMLVDLKEIGEGDIEVDYILENPTGRIFQFSSTLATSEFFKIYDYKNQMNFLVLPFMKERIKFRYRIMDEYKEKQLLRLPELKVYDLNYKVYLNQLIVTDKIEASKEGEMQYVNRQATKE
ncbi:DEKNAAC100491 [Brettanomyces naardenensis]|uniref:DEKNAAC100491 n=1 Tax=Brettanomyces naardenensis TaxID=13370 RepID=A0A448YGG6_BRENA|nr:DEKNAAC100491 [Brettanomyces naardenensis]